MAACLANDLTNCIKNNMESQVLVLMPVILATQEAEIRRIMVQSQPGHTVVRPYLEKNP
jgi:hypothetical protein